MIKYAGEEITLVGELFEFGPDHMRIRATVIATGEEITVPVLDQQVVIEDGEDLEDVAKELLGPKGQASYVVLGLVPGDMWPTIRYIGTRSQLAAIAAKAMGSPVGYPTGRPRS